MKERERELVLLPSAAAVSCQQQYSVKTPHVIIKTLCHFNTAAYEVKIKHKGKVNAVDIIDLDVAVCEPHDINSAFSTRNFTRFGKSCPKWGLWTGKERKGAQRGDWLQGVRPNGNQRLWDVRTAIDLYFTCSLEICHTYTGSEQNKRRGRDVKKYGQKVKGQTVRED